MTNIRENEHSRDESHSAGMAENPVNGPAGIPVSQEQLRREVDYARAQRILESMLDKGLISLSEFDRITALNRQTFSPTLAEIMPSGRCYHTDSEVT